MPCLGRTLSFRMCRTLLFLLWLLSANAAANSAVAAPSDVPGWKESRWGMTAEELQAAMPESLTALPGRWQYGRAYADHAELGTEVGGLAFNAYFQMSHATDRLEQVLLERRRRQATPAAFEELLDALEAAYGPARETCQVAKSGGEPLRYELVWRFPSTTLHAGFLDFSSTSVLHRDPRAPIDPLVSHRDVRRIVRGFVPRRILIRLHAAEREDLVRPCPSP